MCPLISGSTDFSDIDKLFDNFESIYDNVKLSLLEKTQKALLENIQRLAPRNTGDYASSWKLGPIKDGKATITTDQGKLFLILERGAQPQKRSRKPPQKPYVFKGKNGETIFTFKINWPGFDAIPHAGPALKLTMQQVPEIFKDEIKLLFA